MFSTIVNTSLLENSTESKHRQFSKYPGQSNCSWLEMKVVLAKINAQVWKECQFKYRKYIQKLKLQMASPSLFMQEMTEDSKPQFLKS